MASTQPYYQHAHAPARPEKAMTVWDQNREIIHQLFILENRTLLQVKNALESEHGFPEFRLIDYEVVLREHFGFRKNLKKEDWLAIECHREQRRQEGKASNVYLQGLLIEKPRVDRAVRRSKNGRKLPYRGRRGPTHLLPEGVTMRTPSPVLPCRPAAPGMSMTNATNMLLIRSSWQSAYQGASGPNTLPINVCTTQRQISSQISVEEMRLHIPFMKFAETIKLHYNLDTSMSPLPTYTGAHHPSQGSVQLPEHSKIRTINEILAGFHQNGTAQQRPTTKEHRQDRLTTRNIAFAGGKFEFDKLMRVFFVLSNKQNIYLHEGREIVEWIEAADLGVLRALFSLPFSTVAAAWEQLIRLSLVLRGQRAFVKLVEISLTIQKRAWITTNAGDVLGTAIWLGLGDCVQRLLRDGVSPTEPLNRCHMNPFLDNGERRYHMYDFQHPKNPLQVAILRSDVETIMELFRYGVKPDQSDTSVMGRALRHRTAEENHDVISKCLKVLLDAGADADAETRDVHPIWWYTNRQSAIEQLGWLPGRPKYLPDILWHLSADKKCLRGAFDLVSKHSERMRNSLTVPGLHDAASRGCGELLRYLNSRAKPVGKGRDILLEAALSQAASRGESTLTHTFIQIGVDPNVQEIYSQTIRPDTWSAIRNDFDIADLAEQWVPVIQASKNFDIALLEILFDAGMSCNHYNLINALLNEGEEDWSDLYTRRYPYGRNVDDTVGNGCMLGPATIDNTYDCLLKAGLYIRIHGNAAMARILMRWGEKEPKVASLQCEWLHSKGVEWSSEMGGRNLVHCAVRWRCDLDLILFFVARGVKVHSSPCSENTTMLYDALQSGCSLDVLNFLLNEGADVHDQSYGGRSILQPVLFSRVGEVRSENSIGLKCKRLIEAGATIFSQRQALTKHTQPPSEILGALIKLSDIEDCLIFRLLETDQNIDLCYESGRGCQPIGTSPVQAAIENGRLNLAQELLHRARKEQNALSILSMALYWSTQLCTSSPENLAALDFMMFLIRSGARIEVLTVNGLNPLHIAAMEGSLNVASVLLENGADPNTPIRRVWIRFWEQNSPDNPIRFSTTSWTLRFRPASKGDFNPSEGIVYDKDGLPEYAPEYYGPVLAPRALDVAAFCGRVDMVQLLLNAGGISGHHSITPYDGAIACAQYNGQHTVAHLLEESCILWKTQPHIASVPVSYCK